MSTVENILKSTVGVTALAVTVAGALAYDRYLLKERPVPASLATFDADGDGGLSRDECLAIASKVVDVNHDGVIDDDELNTKGEEVVKKFRSALGKSNLDSAEYLQKTLRELNRAPSLLADWQAVVNKAKHLKTSAISKMFAPDFPVTEEQIRKVLEDKGIDVVSVEKLSKAKNTFLITCNYPEGTEDPDMYIARPIIAWEFAETDKIKKEEKK